MPERDDSTERRATTQPAADVGAQPGEDAETSSHERRRALHRGLLFATGALVPILAVLLVWKAANGVLLLFAGYLVAVFLRALTRFVKNHSPLSHRWAFAVVMLVLVALAVGVGWWMAPRVNEQVQQLSEELPAAVEQATEQLQDYEWVRWFERRMEEGDGEQGAAVSWLRRALGVFATTVGAITGFLILLWTGIYIAFDPHLYERGAVGLVPQRHRERVSQVFTEMDETLAYWMLGKVAAMLIIGILTWIGLSALGIPLAFTLSLLAALLTFIPNFGPIASTIPPALLALAQAPIKALWVVLLFLGIQFVESYLVTPLIQRRAIAMPPALIVLAQVVLSLLFGFLGLLVATPLAAALIVLVKRLYVEDVLEEDGEHPTPEEALQRTRERVRGA